MIKEFLSFDKMITPSIIKFIWWVSSIICVITGFILILQGTSSYYGGSLVFFGLITILVGPFISRIYCELLIVFFKINEGVQEIKKDNGKNSESF